MEIGLDAEAKDKSLNRRVAVTVVVLSIFMGVSQVKDGNIVQGMAQAQAFSADRWNEYQATRTKRHIDEVALSQLTMLGPDPADPKGVAEEKARLTTEMAKYDSEAPALRKQAEGFNAQYDALNVHDDQFDASDAFIGIAVAIAAVAALAESGWALVVAWAFGALGVVMGMARFLGLGLHLDFLAKLLG